MPLRYQTEASTDDESVVDNHRRRVLVEFAPAAFLADDDVFDTGAVVPGPEHRRLDGKSHPHLERGVVLFGDERFFVDVEPDAMAGPVAEPVTEACIYDHLARGGIDRRRGDTGAH